jgi:uncharacterized ParB-like nuclease family protein
MANIRHFSVTDQLRIGDTVRHESDDGSMGTAQVIAIEMGHAWCYYRKADCHRVQALARLERLS